MKPRLLVLVPLAALCCSCATSAPDPIRIEGVPHIQQRPDFCGEACVAMWCGKLGRDIDQDAVFNHAGLDPLLGRGCHTRDLRAALIALGFDPGRGGVWVKADAPREIDQHLGTILGDLRAGVPTIVCMRYGPGEKSPEHFRLLLGFDPATDELIYHEPAVAEGAYRRIKRAEFRRLWPLKYEPRRWLLVSLPLKGEAADIETDEDAEGSRDAEIAQHVLELKELIADRSPGSTFHFERRGPFVIAGDEAPGMVRRRADHTVAWAVRRLKRQYFEKDPEDLITIWLFRDAKSYEGHLKRFWNTEPFTPYGYYSSDHNALIMNIATGGGTLVHEIVHPYVAANFPACASWFNEGLGSLYEQSADRGGRIVGRTNWRLAGLQRAIRKDQVPPFETLCATTTHEFYEEDPGTNYAQARYLCYYLQERGLLESYYREYRANAEDDPGGWDTLREILGKPDMEAFQARWEKWVLTLEFP